MTAAVPVAKAAPLKVNTRENQEGKPRPFDHALVKEQPGQAQRRRRPGPFAASERRGPTPLEPLPAPPTCRHGQSERWNRLQPWSNQPRAPPTANCASLFSDVASGADRDRRSKYEISSRGASARTRVCRRELGSCPQRLIKKFRHR